MCHGNPDSALWQSERGRHRAHEAAGDRAQVVASVDPCPDGGLGVVKQGGYADLLLVDGNPLECPGAVIDPKNLKVRMKVGRIDKETL